MKDPAILFYTSDFLTGTITMTDDQVGKYIRLLCLQHQKGSLTEKDMLFICKSYDEDIFQKFEKNEEGRYINIRLNEEVTRRAKYSESRATNRKHNNKIPKINGSEQLHMNNICETYDKHMETENENINSVLKEGGTGGEIDFTKTISYWNVMTKFNKIVSIPDDRKEAILKIVSVHGRESLKTVFDKAARSKFLNGENQKHWKATFDWVIDPANFIKILEGNYDNKKEIIYNL